MSLTSVLRIGTSGLKTSQAGLRAVSDNISNVNTPGFVRKVVDQEASVIAGQGMGVQVSGVRRAADIYLQRTSLSASAEAGRASVVAGFTDRAQLMFGDPSASTSFFKQLDDIFTSFSKAAEAPTSNLLRSASVNEVTRFFEDAGQISQSLSTLRQETDGRIASAIDQANSLLDEIERLNKEIGSAVVSGRDATGAENAQSKLIDELSQYMDIRISTKPFGGVVLRAGDGTEIAGGQGAAQLTYDRSAGAGGLLSIIPAYGAKRPFSQGLEGGEIKGLIELRQTILPGMREQLGELTTRAADALNKAHNSASAVPPPALMTGRQTGLDLPTAVAGFTGRTSISVLDQAGVEHRRVDIDFTAGTLSVDGGAATAFTPAGFQGSVNAALGAYGTMNFSGGVMTLAADSPAPAPLPATTQLGVAIVDPPQGGSDRGGRAFSHYFGLNDLVRSDRYAFFETGLRPTDGHGFTPGQAITFRIVNPAGGREEDITVTVPPAGVGTDMAALLGTSAGALNDPTGMGRYGVFALDSEGSLAFTPHPAKPVQLSVLTDTTMRGAGGPTLTDLFGVGSDRRSSRAEGFSVRPDIAQNSAKLAFAQMDYAAAPGARRLAKGDGSGAFALADAFEVAMRFEPAGTVGALNMSVSSYAAELGGVVGRAANAAAERRDNAALVAKEADARRAGVEGVNLDEELIALTTYQQSYNASARLIQAASEMYETLVNMI